MFKKERKDNKRKKDPKKTKLNRDINFK